MAIKQLQDIFESRNVVRVLGLDLTKRADGGYATKHTVDMFHMFVSGYREATIASASEQLPGKPDPLAGDFRQMAVEQFNAGIEVSGPDLQTAADIVFLWSDSHPQ